MNKIDLGQTLAILANVGVIVGIIFLAVELRQNNRLIDEQSVIARVNAYAALASSGIASRDSVNQQAETWAKGVAGRELEEWEQVVFENLVVNLNDQAITTYTAEDDLEHPTEAELTLNDFALFLYQNPGARRVWRDREENLNRYRRMLTPETANRWSFWQERISEALSRLDAADQ